MNAELTQNQMITLKNNYIHKLAGRAPKVAGNTLLHAVNNYWHDSRGHAFELGDAGAMVLAEGNVFQNVAAPVVEDGRRGRLFSAPSTSAAAAACAAPLGRACELNGFGSSGSFAGSDTSFLQYFAGKNVASATPYTAAKSVIDTAGFGKI